LSEKMRVHILAKELNVPSKTIIDKCKAEGITSVKNHMSTLSAGLHATILEWFSEGQHETAVETAERVDLEKVRIRRRRKTATVGAGSADRGADTAVVDDESLETDDEQQIETLDDDEREPPPKAKPRKQVLEAPPIDTDSTSLNETATEVAAGKPTELPEPTLTPAEPPVVADQETAPVAPAESETPEIEEPEVEDRQEVAPAGPQNIPKAAKLQGPRVVRYEAPDKDVAPPRRGRGREAGYESPYQPDAPARPSERPAETDKTGKKAKPPRRGGRLVEAGERIHEWRNRDLEERRERLAGATGRRIHRRRSVQSTAGPTRQQTGPKTEATVHEPVRLKELCAETGLNFMQLFRVLKEEHNIIANVNMTIPVETAQLVALHFGIELTVVPQRTALDALQDEVAQRERTHLQPRPPVVTILGHVDHGKTSLLDAIRKSRVVSEEDGGITQHISSYHMTTAQGAVTFLDTPGHEAFTAMRARGAQLTDVVVLVVAADDGVMPQTVEAIRHAQAAKVPIVVALNKIDLGDQNKLKIYGQLSEHELTPSEWGGEVDVIPTSAKTREGITELVEHLAALSSVLELKSDPTVPAVGTAIEAETKPGVGPVVQLLVQEGTLRVGDFVVCGNACGKVRALINDVGKRIDEAGPAIPVEVWGLDDVPSSGDKLFSVANVQRAKEIASEVKQQRIESARIQSRKAKSLEDMFKQRDTDEVPELNVVIKADVDGSAAALKQALGEIPSDEVRLTIRHAAVGPVNDSDILLAATCDGIVIAFRVDVSGGAKRLADEHGVEIRPYRVIYDVCDDVRKALSGLLAPEERIEERATAEVRQVFRMSKIGVVAGCYVTDGVVDRSHYARLIRDGAVIREGCRLASLRHFRDDVRTVRAGQECGIRLEGFDDVHMGDRIEMYEVVKIARSL
jgi:translation initiation factor IF-2